MQLGELKVSGINARKMTFRASATEAMRAGRFSVTNTTARSIARYGGTRVS
jgi:hypothetical protein